MQKTKAVIFEIKVNPNVRWVYNIVNDLVIRWIAAIENNS